MRYAVVCCMFWNVNRVQCDFRWNCHVRTRARRCRQWQAHVRAASVGLRFVFGFYCTFSKGFSTGPTLDATPCAGAGVCVCVCVRVRVCVCVCVRISKRRFENVCKDVFIYVFMYCIRMYV